MAIAFRPIVLRMAVIAGSWALVLMRAKMISLPERAATNLIESRPRAWWTIRKEIPRV